MDLMLPPIRLKLVKYKLTLEMANSVIAIWIPEIVVWDTKTHKI